MTTIFCRAKKLPSFDLVDQILKYNPDNGYFFWKTDRGTNKVKDTVAGRITSTGYIYISIDSKSYAAHRLAFLLHTGKDPYPYEVDHINHDKEDNSFKNLRKATIQQNSSNRQKGSNNSSGHKSIRFMESQPLNPYFVCIRQKKIGHSLGSFPTLKAAIEARDKKGREIYGEFYHP